MLGNKSVPPATYMDSPGCAAVVGYTKFARLGVLQKTAEIVRNPPFTNQLTYCEDQARLSAVISRLTAAAGSPEALRQARTSVRAAIAADPANPTLARIEEEIDRELGDPAGALAQVRRAEALLPADLELLAEEASLLGQLGRFDEARQLLLRAARLLGDDKVVPPFAALAARSRQFAAGREVFDRALARHPTDHKLRMMRATLARLGGDPAAAERDFRAVLADDPANQSALEALVSLLSDQSKATEVEAVSLAFAESQPRNQLNNLRVANIAEARGDEAQSLRYLQAAEHSGPLPAGMELRLARMLFHLQRWDESLLHLAVARRLAAIEEDSETADSIGQLIEQVRARAN